MSVVNIVIEDRTKPLSEVGLNKILLFTSSADIPYKETDNVAGITELTAEMTGYKALELILAQAKQTVAVYGKTGITTESAMKSELNRIIDKDFFFVVTDITTPELLVGLGEWASSADRIAIVTPEKGASMDIVKGIATNTNSDNVAVYAHAKTTETIYLNAGISGLMSPKPAGSATWALKSPNLIPMEFFPLADENELIKANINVWALELGRGITKGGKTTSGSYVDITQGKYWLKNKLRAELSLLLMNRDKLPFTLTGKTLIEDAIEKVVKAGDAQGIIIRSETTIFVPDPLELLTNDRAQRKWEGITVETRISGAVESLSVRFILSV